MRIPYVGPRPFLRGECLYGRDDEALDLKYLIEAGRVVLLYGSAGSGKTSLLNAALIPELEADRFHVSAGLRVGAPPPVGYAGNRYVYSLASQLFPMSASDSTEGAEATVAGVLSHAEAELGVGDVPHALVFDQFEELLTLDPSDREAKAEFLLQLAEALQESRRSALISIREDHVGELDRYLRGVVWALARYPIDPLTFKGAKEAVVGPAQDQGVVVEEGVIDLLTDLSTLILPGSRGDPDVVVLSPFIEPMQLQVVCRRWWAETSKALGGEFTYLGRSDFERLGNAAGVLETYYEQVVASTVSATSFTEAELRDWIEGSLISANGRRSLTNSGPRPSSEGGEQALTRLMESYLVRSTAVQGTVWYELTSDRLAGAALASNRAWRAEHPAARRVSARAWQSRSVVIALLVLVVVVETTLLISLLVG